MARRARVVLPGFLHHVTQRGNYRQDVFEEDQDRAVYLKHIQELSAENGLDIYAYCLMRNHVHFIVRPQAKNTLARVFSIVHMRYAHYLHKKREVNGHLWQGRFYSCLVHGEHIPRAVRYVECNPVRAGLAAKAWDYPWSSARAHLKTRYKIISLADIGEYFEAGQWKDFLQENEEDRWLDKIRENTRKGRLFAPDEFIQEMEKTLNRKLIFPPPGRPGLVIK